MFWVQRAGAQGTDGFGLFEEVDFLFQLRQLGAVVFQAGFEMVLEAFAFFAFFFYVV